MCYTENFVGGPDLRQNVAMFEKNLQEGTWMGSANKFPLTQGTHFVKLYNPATIY